MERKREVRRNMMRLRQEMDLTEKQEMDERICNQMLKALDGFRHVYCYVSYGTEIDTRKLIRKLWEQGVSVAVPRVDHEAENRMDFYWITGTDDLVPGYRGIPEPAAYCKRADDRKAPVITPGLAFTAEGARIGYGGGYYDRFFAAEPEHMRIAAAYPFQVLEEIPTEKTDRKLHKIVTGEKLYECKQIIGTGGICYGID